ncbi:hypothetical protein ACOME3_007655 [Neoechinorhynchus agilis]
MSTTNTHTNLPAQVKRALMRRRMSTLRSEITYEYESSNNLDHQRKLKLDSKITRRQTSIVATLGPASHSVQDLKKLIIAGMDIARFNFSHGSHEYHTESVMNLREALKQLHMPQTIALALDTKGPEIRTGEVRKPTMLKQGESIYLTVNNKYEQNSDEKVLFVTYKALPTTVLPNQLIFINDGLMRLRVVRVYDDGVDCKIEEGGELTSRKGVNIPGASLELPPVSEKDKNDLRFAVQNQFDFVFASFINNAAQIVEIRRLLEQYTRYLLPGSRQTNIKVIAKIESMDGVENIDQIIAMSDGIMVARGDLGIEIPAEKVFVAQKMIVAKCNLVGKPVICATQMLESMTSNPRATRAETTTANAILDGVDCVMLSGETAKGKYPSEAVYLMHQVAREAESCTFYKQAFDDLRFFAKPPLKPADAIAIAAVEASFRVFAPSILVCTCTGAGAIRLSKYRPRAVIVAVTQSNHVARQLKLHRGIISAVMGGFQPPGISAVICDKQASTIIDDDSTLDGSRERIEFGIKEAKRNGVLESGDPVVVVFNARMGLGDTDTVKVLKCP